MSPVNPVSNGRNVALVLGSGGARGLAHIGVIEALVSEGFTIQAVVGCSMGALVGGVYAAGRLQEYKDWTSSLEKSGVLRLLDFSFGNQGLIKGDRVIGVLKELVGDYRIEDLPIEFTAIATDLKSQREVWLSRGKLFDAIRASIAIPMLLTPHRVNGRELVDGGLLSPVPMAPTRQMVVDRVIAVDVNGPVHWRPVMDREKENAEDACEDEEALASAYGVDVYAQTEDDEKSGHSSLRERLAALWNGDEKHHPMPANQTSVMELMSQSLDTMHAAMSRMQLAQDPPDMLIQIPRESCSFHEYWRAKEMIELGHKIAMTALTRMPY
ncbi:MAG TPA: patatin-like phospholipase family protein [Arenimonas sp.]|jgi:NTE family protein|nr:patatin-like phospholipase family protein [Arenimonas sp.]HOZ04061.1 patatin-like phospholipase family protein [Arenimonas sp.]HPO23907.1 patatin-like phospholipase family protein [Arenimonas sp.]HPW31873.1 patatin-like phospholipase family protein [Arenimonas sp.]